jgi:hypothetical protein
MTCAAFCVVLAQKANFLVAGSVLVNRKVLNNGVE